MLAQVVPAGNVAACPERRQRVWYIGRAPGHRVPGSTNLRPRNTMKPTQMRRLGAGCLALLLVTADGVANAQQDSLAQGAGTQTCREMYEYSATKWQSNRNVAPFYQSWFHGFLSGMNVANFAHVARRPPFVIGPSDLRAKVEAYCDANPDDDLLTVAVKLYYSRNHASAQ